MEKKESDMPAAHEQTTNNSLRPQEKDDNMII